MAKKTIEDELLEAKRTAQVSKERLKRITKTRRHHLRNSRRVVKYGVKSFVRNTWLSVAAIAIMVVTLVVLSSTLVAANAMQTAINQVANKVDISIYLKQGASQSQVSDVVSKIKKLDIVADVKTLSPEVANAQIIDQMIEKYHITDKDQIQAMREAPNKIAWTLNVKMRELDDTDQLEEFVNNDEGIQALLDETNKPTFASEHRQAIDTITEAMNRIRVIGLSAAGIFAAIAILVVFNTIRMAIFNRKEEIYMMRLVGASRWFIVGPFVVEASIYGIVAAIIAGAVLYCGVYGLLPHFEGMLDSTHELMVQYWYIVAAALVGSGILIGIVSSLLATSKYLRQK